MAVHISKICSAAFYHLHNIRRIRKYLSIDAAATLIHSIVSSRMDYRNRLLYGVPKCHIDKLQRVKTQPPDLSLCRANFAILPQCSSSSISHWLPVSFRINFKICSTFNFQSHS